MTQDNDVRDITQPIRPRIWKAVILGTLSGWVLVFLPYAATLLVKAYNAKSEPGLVGWAYDYNVSLLLLLPMLQGLVGAMMRGGETQSVRSGWGVMALILVLDILAAGLIMREGAICLIMAFPLLLALVGIGYAIGRALVRWRGGKTLSVSLMPLIVLGVVAETVGPLPDYRDEVTDVMTVDAPADYVWRYVVQYPDNPNPPAYWLWKAGLPAPTHSVASVPAVGQHRECRFTGGYAYSEIITRLEPGQVLTYRVTEQMKHPEIFGHVTFDEGEVLLTPLGRNRTRITMTGRYRLHVRPARYFAWWSQDVARHIHMRTMSYMKMLAERDYEADVGK